MTNKLATTSAFSNIQSFEDAQRMAKALCQSTIVPKAYQNNVPNTIVALEMANRIGISAIMVMQNLDVIQGKPSWRSSFIISALNSCGRFSPLRWEVEGDDPKDDNYRVRSLATSLDDDKEVKGPWITWEMVKSEGWLQKTGSKWKTMPELMFQYRSASFFGRLYAPDILTGMHSVNEIVDIQHTDLSEAYEQELQEIQELIPEVFDLLSEDEHINIDRIIETKETNSYSKLLKHLRELKKKQDDTEQK